MGRKNLLDEVRELEEALHEIEEHKRTCEELYDKIKRTIETKKDEYRKRHYFKRIDDIIRVYKRKHKDEFKGEFEGKFPIWIIDCSSPYEYIRAGLMGEKVYIFEFSSRYYKFLCEGETHWGGKGGLKWRLKNILHQRGLAILVYFSDEPLKGKSNEEIIAKAGLRRPLSGEYIIRQLFAEDGKKVVEISVRKHFDEGVGIGSVVREYVSPMDLW